MRGCVAAVLLSFFAVAAFPACNVNSVASAPFRSTIYSVSAENGRLWAATGYGITLYDITVDPPRILDTIPLRWGSTRVVRASNGVAYAASGSAIQTVRWTGRELQLAQESFVDIGTINDLLVSTDNSYLYVATDKGILLYDLFHGPPPQLTTAKFPTSGTNVTSL